MVLDVICVVAGILLMWHTKWLFRYFAGLSLLTSGVAGIFAIQILSLVFALIAFVCLLISTVYDTEKFHYRKEGF